MDYPYRVEAGLLQRLPEELAALGLPRAVVVTDRHLAELYPEPLSRWGAPLVVPPGEQSKSLAQTAALYDQLVERGVNRRTALVAVGGGVVGDLAGFVAATFLRGLPLVQVPTTLLAMVDSSLGGKVGVDLPSGKNLVGAFYPPKAVLCDPDVLATLPPREWSGGMAEVIKHAILDSPEFFRDLDRPPADLIERAAAVKIAVVTRDPYEQGERAHLNLGHTLGHALETVTGYARFHHGEAVALGLLAATRLSRELGVLEQDFEPALEERLRRSGLPVRLPAGLSWEPIAAAMARDKKNVDGRLTFVLPVRLGQVRVYPGVDPEHVRKVYEALCEPS